MRFLNMKVGLHIPEPERLVIQQNTHPLFFAGGKGHAGKAFQLFDGAEDGTVSFGNVDLRDLTACHRTCVGHGKRYAMFIGGQIGVGKLRIA